MLGPRDAMRAIARTMLGKAMTPSMIRMSTPSSLG